MLIVFGCLGAVKENGRIRAGVVIPDDDTMAMALVNTVKNMGELSSLCDFSVMTEAEGKKKLEQGAISALIVVPKQILQKIYRNDKVSIALYMPEKPTLESAVIREFAEAGTTLVLTAKAGDFTVYQMYQKYKKAGTIHEVAKDMNGRYIQFVMQNETLFSNHPVDELDNRSDEDRMVAAGIALVLLLLGIPMTNLRKKQPAILSLALARKGIHPLFSLVLDGCLVTLCLFIPMFMGTFVLGNLLEWEMAVLVLAWGLFCGCLMNAAFLLMLHACGQGRTGNVLLIFFASFAQIFLAGGIFPVSVLPELFVRIGNLLPGGLLMRLLHEGITGGGYSLAGLVLCGYDVLFFVAAFRITAENGRKCA